MKLKLRSERKHDPEIRRYCYCGGGDGGDAPAVDPLVGQAMQTMADTGKKVSEYQMDLTERLRPYYEQLLQQNVQAGDTATQRADQEWGMYDTYGVPMSRIVTLLDAIDPTMALSDEERSDLLAQFTGAERSRADRQYQAGLRKITQADEAKSERDAREAAIDRDQLRAELLPQFSKTAASGPPQPRWEDGQWWYPQGAVNQDGTESIYTLGVNPGHAYGKRIIAVDQTGKTTVDEEGLNKALEARVQAMLGGDTTGYNGKSADDLAAEHADRTANLGLSASLSGAIDKASRRAAEAAGTRAGAETQKQHDLSQQVAERNMSRMGVNPGSTAAAFASRGAGLRRAADVAGSTNNAQTSSQLAGVASRGNALNTTRGYPSTTLQFDQSGTLNRNAAVNTMQGQQQSSIAGMNAALPWYSGVTDAGTNLYRAQIAGYQAENSGDDGFGSILSGVGSLASGISAFSSEELKENKEPVREGVLPLLRKLNVEKWDYKDGVEDEGTHVGPYAEDVQAQLGDQVAPGGKQIDLVSMNGMLLKGVQELAEEVDQLKRGGTREKSVALPRRRREPEAQSGRGRA